ncbi:AP-2 complex subunit mu [Symbiodinium microadriaticum]|uniref:AP-2 complex subunit mu n=1 Tax=Symbiodinium microadriaticum TaxID=2951 RepID=A0A1Q9D7K1_SYMMI|nr:AP-2 complex subunit mu [Symbiodinium microadriaticum]
MPARQRRVEPSCAKRRILLRAEQLKKITVQATGVCSWRAEGIKHKKNEVFIDVIEKVNILVSTKRERLRADVSGEILVNCKLSGMPECKFGMNDKLVMSADARARSSDKGIALDDYGFHQCVRLGKFDVDREITFIPPDEQFSLMTYRITENIESPFKLIPNVKVLGRTRLELSLQVTAMYDRNIEATNVRIDFPCPKNTAKAHIPSPGHGKARYDANESAVIWRIRRFPGRHEYNLLAEETMTCQIEHVFANWTYLNDVIDEKISKVNTGEEFSVFVSYAGCDVPKEAFAKSTRTIATLRDDCCRAFPSLIMQGDVARYFCVSLLSKDTCDGKSDITGEKLKMENGNFIDIQPSEQIEIKFV